ncbi:MAG: hypothetical protein GXP18_00150 [Gammaproteobacteria bacterium]|nr:hypothetical protein [Gammaproteobacteria bacterium]
MKHFVKTSVATAVVLGATLAATGAFASVAGTIVNTRHNMGSTGQGPNTASANDTAEICIFCHTPHGGDTGAAVPLWNKQLSTATFSTYDQLGTSTLDAAVGTVGSISLACLTCHDGTQAIDNIINAPGSGGYNPDGGPAGGIDGLGWTWTTDGTLDGTGRFVGSVDEGGSNIWAIGTDLTNDHPVSMQYGGGGYSSPSNRNGGAFGGLSATRDMDFVAAINIGGNSDRWYVDNTAMAAEAPLESQNNILDKWDLKLYTRDTDAAATTTNGATFTGEREPFVECGSCHDPHYETTTFLRMGGQTDLLTDLNGGVSPDLGSAQSNRGSRLCLACHAK